MSTNCGIPEAENSTAGVGASRVGDAEGRVSARWLAYYTAPRHEKAVAKYLDYQLVERFLPVVSRARRWKNGVRVQVDEPFFPGYIFARIAPRFYYEILNLPGVISVVGTGRKPFPLEDEEIESLRSGLASRNSEPHPLLVVGKKVLIRSGAFAGKTGVLIKKSSNMRVVLTVEAIMKSFSVEVDGEELEMVS